jgi:ribonuclease HII
LIGAENPDGGRKGYFLEKSSEKKAGGARKKRSLPQSFELAAITIGFKRVAGVDEAGRGPLAGPVVAAAVILGRNCALLGIDDSKKLTAKRRETLYDRILECSVASKIARVDPPAIDRLNIYRASLLAMKMAAEGLGAPPDFIYVDGPKEIDVSIPQLALVDGDARCCSVAAASIIAKVSRDRLMREYDEIYPGYGFSRHKGYGTAEHLSALRKLGPSPIHRRSFGPVRELIRP